MLSLYRRSRSDYCRDDAMRCIVAAVQFPSHRVRFVRLGQLTWPDLTSDRFATMNKVTRREDCVVVSSGGIRGYCLACRGSLCLALPCYAYGCYQMPNEAWNSFSFWEGCWFYMYFERRYSSKYLAMSLSRRIISGCARKQPAISCTVGATTALRHRCPHVHVTTLPSMSLLH